MVDMGLNTGVHSGDGGDCDEILLEICERIQTKRVEPEEEKHMYVVILIDLCIDSRCIHEQLQYTAYRRVKEINGQLVAC